MSKQERDNILKKHRRGIRRCAPGVLFGAVLATGMLTGCISDYGTCPLENTTEKLSVRIDLVVPGADLATRTSGHDKDFGSDVENAINVDGDYRVLVFDKNGDLADDVEMDCDISDISEKSTTYTLSGKMDISKAEDKAKLETFRIMVLANWEGFDAATNADGSQKKYENFPFPEFSLAGTENNIYKNGSLFNFTMPVESSNKAWQPNGKVKCIPMFGVSEPISLEYAAEMGKYGDGPVTSIPMLRAIAKVEIVDHTSHHPITNVTLSHRISIGRFIPDIEKNPEWNEVNTQMMFPSIPSGFSMTEETQFFNSTHEEDAEATVWSLYIPEIDFTTSPALNNRPVVQIMSNGKRYAFQLDNKVEKASQNVSNPSKGDGSLDYVLRNHIYRYTITENGADLQVSLNILPWDMEWEDDEWHFDLPAVKLPDDFDEENPEYPYHLKWTTQKEDPDNPGVMIDNGYIDMESSLMLIMKASTDDYAEGKFTLAAPLKATWYAVLVPLQGEHDAFEFYNDGTRTWDHGIIDGNEAVIKIRNTREIVNDERNEARLEIMVEYPDKTQKQAFVVNPSLSGNNYTIVQQKTSLD